MGFEMAACHVAMSPWYGCDWLGLAFYSRPRLLPLLLPSWLVVVPPWEYAEYGTHLLAALLVEMAGQHHYQMRTWGHGDSRGN